MTQNETKERSGKLWDLVVDRGVEAVPDAASPGKVETGDKTQFRNNSKKLRSLQIQHFWSVWKYLDSEKLENSGILCPSSASFERK